MFLSIAPACGGIDRNPGTRTADAVVSASIQRPASVHQPIGTAAGKHPNGLRGRLCHSIGVQRHRSLRQHPAFDACVGLHRDIGLAQDDSLEV